MSNASGINPKGWRVLLRPLEVEEKTKSGIILSSKETNDREQLANTTGEVVAIGADVNGWCAVGDRIVHAKYAGLMYLGKDGVMYRMVNDEDVVAVLDDDVKLVDPHLAKGL